MVVSLDYEDTGSFVIILQGFRAVTPSGRHLRGSKLLVCVLCVAPNDTCICLN